MRSQASHLNFAQNKAHLGHNDTERPLKQERQEDDLD